MHKLILSKDIEQFDYLTYIEKLNYIGITSSLYGIVGDWLISNEGDLLYFCIDNEDKNAFYPIYSHLHNDQNWSEHLKTKIWFTGCVQTDFIVAFDIAKQLRTNNNQLLCSNNGR